MIEKWEFCILNVNYWIPYYWMNKIYIYMLQNIKIQYLYFFLGYHNIIFVFIYSISKYYIRISPVDIKNRIFVYIFLLSNIIYIFCVFLEFYFLFHQLHPHFFSLQFHRGWCQFLYRCYMDANIRYITCSD